MGQPNLMPSRYVLRLWNRDFTVNRLAWLGSTRWAVGAARGIQGEAAPTDLMMLRGLRRCNSADSSNTHKYSKD